MSAGAARAVMEKERLAKGTARVEGCLEMVAEQVVMEAARDWTRVEGCLVAKVHTHRTLLGTGR